MSNIEVKVILGDQSPWTGGWLRMQAVANVGLHHLHLVQDADAPWKQNGVPVVSTKHGWADYWSLSSKNPWTPSIRGTEINNVRSFYKAPSGLSYLAGPNTSQTIHSERHNPHIAGLMKDLLIREANWARTVGKALGMEVEANYRADQWTNALQKCQTLDDIYHTIGQTHGVDRTQGSIDFFSINPPLLVDQLGKQCYWSIDKFGHRYEHSQHSDGVIVPKGQVLILELCAKGFVLAYTGLGYLDKQVELRNRRVPGLQLNLLQISFAWSLFPEPVSELVNGFAQKKATQNENVDISTEDVGRIQTYWEGRPTSISNSILGGDLNPSFNYQAL